MTIKNHRGQPQQEEKYSPLSCASLESFLRPGGRSNELLQKLLLHWRAVSPLAFATGVLHFDPFEAQAEVLMNAPGKKQLVLNCCRQWGKSTIVAILALHRLLTEAGITELIIGPAKRQSGETLRKVRQFVQQLGIKTTTDGVNKESIQLPNGSRIVSLPGVDATTRGVSAVSLLIVEEAARVPDSVYMAFLPMLATVDGDVILLSTPKGKRGFFHREVMAGNTAESLVHTGPVTECPRVSEAYLERQRAKSELEFRREFLCEFLDDGQQLFSEDEVSGAVSKREGAWRFL